MTARASKSAHDEDGRVRDEQQGDDPQCRQPQYHLVLICPSGCAAVERHQCAFNAPHAARCVARHGVRSNAVPVALDPASVMVRMASWAGFRRFADQAQHGRQRGLEADAVRAESSRNLGVPVVEKPEQEMLGPDPTAFETACLLDRPCERLFRGDAEGNLVDRLGGGAETAQHTVQVFPHGTPPDTEPIQHRERNPVTLPEHREEKMFRIYRAMMAPVRLFVRRPNDPARCLRETVEHAARLLGRRRYVKCFSGRRWVPR